MPFLWCSYFLSESAIWTPNTVEVNGSAGLHKTGLCFHYSPSSPPHTIRLFRHTLIVLHCVAGETQSQEEWDWVRLTNGCLLSLERQQLKHNRKGKAESRDAWMPPWCPGFKFRLGHFGALKTRVFSWLGSMWYLYNKVFFFFLILMWWAIWFWFWAVASYPKRNTANSSIQNEFPLHISWAQSSIGSGA